MTFARLRPADWVVLLAAFALLFATAADWYSTASGEEARRIEGLSGGAGEVDRELREDARIAAEGEERNAWQASAAIDRLVLAGMLLTAALAVAAGFARAAGRAPAPLAGVAAAATALLVGYRLVQEPGLDEATTVQVGAPLALALLGVIALAGARALGPEPAAT